MSRYKYKYKYLSKTVYVPEEYQAFFENLEEYAKKINRSQSYVICEAVREYMEKRFGGTENI
jgi:predicted transcriptional regulator